MTGKKTWAALIAAAAVIVALLLAPAGPATGLAGSQFNAGNIISDGNFYNGAAMSEGEIQNFLQARVGSCANSNCLAIHREDTPTRTWGFGTCSTYVGASAESAARIIFKVQQACNLSAKVILVTLEKEQGLVTDRAPSDGTMRKAMGYGCPDTSVCDSTYYGFFNQVFAAGRQLTWYSNPGGSFTSIRVGQYNAIRLNPDASCGSANVWIANRATAALYYYTPYTPNAAALSNLYGTGDSCSAYGNRNFWRIYNDWFGASVGPDGPTLIAAEYAAQGGAASLGVAVSGVLPISENGGGLGQAFANGSIYWSASTGALTVRAGAIRDYYFRFGGAGGSLGWPTYNQSPIAANGGGSAQSFTGGSIYASPAGAFAVSAAARRGYFTQSGAEGVMGWPKADQVCDLAGGGCSQAFQGGNVYWTPGTDSYAVFGPISAAFMASGGTGGPWGQPVSDLVVAGSGSGQAYSNGSAYANGSGPAFYVSGPVRDLYFARGGATGSLGFPTASQRCDLPNGECTQPFQYGAVIVTKAGVARVASPEIEAAYARNGGAGGRLGQRSGELLYYSANGGGLAQAYVGGPVYWKQGLGAFAVTSKIKDAYFATAGAAGPFGWPKQDAQCNNAAGTCTQAFEGGTFFSSDSGTFGVMGAVLAAYTASGGPSGAWGAPLSGSIGVSENGGGQGQAFAQGSAYAATPGPARFVSGAVRDTYFAYGGAAGVLGFPTADAQCGLPGNGCAQSFQNGSIYWSSATGGQIVTGAFAAKYFAAGGATGAWGMPLTGAQFIAPNGGGFGQAFQSASLYSATGGAPFAVTGAIRDYYFSTSGAAGALGFPVSDVECGLAGGSCRQAFQGGTVFWSAATGAQTVASEYLTKYTASGGPAGTWGLPTTSLLAVNVSGTAQAFQSVSAYRLGTSGVFAVAGGIRDFYFARGGATGVLGYPTGDAACGSNAVCSQQFQGGRVSYSSAAGGTIG